MPTLTWRGKDAVLNHHLEVPYRLLKCEPELSAGCPGSGKQWMPEFVRWRNMPIDDIPSGSETSFNSTRHAEVFGLRTPVGHLSEGRP